LSKNIDLTYGIKPFNGKYNSPYTYKMWVEDVTVHAKHYYKNQQYFEGIKNNNIVSPTITTVIIGLFILVAFLYSYHRKRLNLLLQTFFNWKVAKQVIRYEKVYSHPVNVILFIVFLIGSPLFYAFAYQKISFADLNVFYAATAIAVAVLFYLVIKLFLYKASAWLFRLDDIIEEYIFQSNFFNKLFGLINLILLVLLLFSPISISLIVTTSFSIFLIFLIIQLIRGILIGMQKAITMHLIILYLCTLEILPWLIIGKWIKNIL